MTRVARRGWLLQAAVPSAASRKSNQAVLNSFSLFSTSAQETGKSILLRGGCCRGLVRSGVRDARRSIARLTVIVVQCSGGLCYIARTYILYVGVGHPDLKNRARRAIHRQRIKCDAQQLVNSTLENSAIHSADGKRAAVVQSLHT